MHEAEGESDLISFFRRDPLKFMMGWRDIFSQHMHDALTGQVYALARAQTHTFMQQTT